jgi:hypothetical protein
VAEDEYFQIKTSIFLSYLLSLMLVCTIEASCTSPEVTCTSRAYFPQKYVFPLASTHITLLVDLGLGQAGNLLGTILDLAVRGLETAQNAGALLDVVIASKLVVCDAVEGTAACEMLVLRYFLV